MAKEKPETKLRRYSEGAVYRMPGSRYWWIRYCAGGREYRESSKSEKRQRAVRLLNSRRGAVADRRFAGLEAERTTLDAMAARVERDYQLNGRRSLPRLKQYFAHLKRFFGGDARPLDGITDARIEDYVAQRQDAGAAASTIKSELGALGHAFRLARLRPPVLPTIHLNNARTGFFTDSEVAALLPHLPVYLRPFIEAAYITGWRRGELRSLRWAQVDWEAGVIRLERGTTKSGEPRSFPFAAHPRLAAIFTDLRVQSETLECAGQIVPWVFHRDGREMRGWYYDSWRTACKKVGLLDAKGRPRLVHDLRRSASGTW